MKKSPLYTRTGDRGTTALVGGQRVAKNSPRVCAYGTVDELNSHIGLVHAHCGFLDDFVPAMLVKISSTLFDLGSHLATDVDPSANVPSPLADDAIADLEHAIDTLDSMTPPLKLFVLPGGTVAACHAHVARTVCRRAEREILTLTSTGAFVHPDAITYVNRLSDYLFALARYINHATGTPELTWRRQK